TTGLTFDQSASSSSATIIGSAVSTPCPISAIGAAMVTVLSAAIVTQPPIALSATPAADAKASGRPLSNPPKAKAKVSPAPPATKPRRVGENASRLMGWFISHLLRGALDRAHDAGIGAAAAEVAVHMRHNLLARGLPVGGEQLRCL